MKRQSPVFVCTFAFVLLLAVSFFPGRAYPQDFEWCGYKHFENGERTQAYDYGSQVRVRYIFVGFPEETRCDSNNVVDPLIYQGLHSAMIDSMGSWLISHSQGNFRLSADTNEENGIVYVPGSDFSSGSSALSWNADLCPIEYRTVATGSSQEVVDYRCKWGFEEGSCTPEVDIGDWRTPSERSYLWAELMYKIYDAYVNGGVDPSEWPFGDHDGVNDDQERVDILAIVLMSKNEIFEHGGSVGIDVDVDKIMQFPDAERFFGNIVFEERDDPESDFGKFHGIFNLQDSSNYQRGVEFDVERCTNVVLHEFTHTLGFPDGPPALQNMDAVDTRRYYYGNLNNLCQKFMPGRGPNIMGLHNLARTNWVNVVDFTGENRFDEVIYDIRSDGDGNPDHEGKIYKFRSEKPGFEDQYFLFAYHAGKGTDGNLWPGAAEPVLNSRGLEVQHIVGLGDPEMVDVESAFGLFHNISSPEMPGIEMPPFPYSNIPGWGEVADSGVMGFDNYDLWWVGGNEQNLRTLVDNGSWAGYTTYMGDVFDFFTCNPPMPGVSDWVNPEFSFRSNPNCFWYGSGEYSGQYTRHNLQDEPNSMIVRIKEQYDDPETGPPYMVVGFISAPYGEVVEPFSEYPEVPLVFDPNEGPLDIVWETEFPDAIDRVDILLSLNGGISYPMTIEEDWPVSGGVTSYSWAPTGGELGTGAALIKVVFKNPYTDYFAESLNPGPFVIAMAGSIAEDFLYPENGEVLEVGEQCDLLWANYHSSETESVDIWYSVDDGENWVEGPTGLLPDVDYIVNNEGFNEYDLTLTQDMASGHARFKLVFHKGVVEGVDISASSVTIMPRTSIEFMDVTAESQVAFAGETYSMNSFQFGPASFPIEENDLLVSFGGVGEEVVLFEKTQFGMGFTENYSAFLGRPPMGISGTVTGDLNNDGHLDLVCASPTNPGVFLYVEGLGKFEAILENPAYFDPLAEGDFKNSFAPVLVDCDKDGDLDIFLGRALKQEGKILPHIDALFVQGPDGSFEEMAGPLGLATKEGATLSAGWCDFDNDGWWEVIVADADEGEPVLYDQVEAQNPQGYEFVARTEPLPYSFGGGVVSVQWADADGDGDFDLLATQDFGSSVVMFTHDGSFSHFTEIPGSELDLSANSTLTDLDHDGWLDVLQTAGLNVVGPQKPQAKIYRHLGSNPGFSAEEWQLVPGALGLGGDNRPAYGLAVNDFNLDGGMDVIVGANTTDDGNVVFKGVPRDGNQGFSNQWLGVNVFGSADNKSSLGAVVKLKTQSGDLLGMKAIDGGSGRGGQVPNRLLFGLGRYAETIEIEVIWPSNPDLSVLELVSPNDFNQVFSISQDTSLEIHRSTISHTMEVIPGSDLVNRIFTWKTNRLTQRSQDKVFIWDGPNFTNLVVVLEAGAPDVVVRDPQFKIDPDTGEVTFEHKVEWLEQECVVGYSFKYEVESCIDANCVPETSRYSIINNRVCPSWH